MRIIVTGFESSGTKWIAGILRQHPDVESVQHTSVPEFFMPDTKYPELNDCDAVVWMVRYEPFRLESAERQGYNCGRGLAFLPPELYSQAISMIAGSVRPIIFIGYESLVGPLGKIILNDAIKRLGLEAERLPEQAFVVIDGNAKYLAMEKPCQTAEASV